MKFYNDNGKKISKIIGNNTYEIKDDNYRAIRLHNTDVIIFKDNRIELNSGGWHTNTTKDRINKHLPQGVYVSQKDFAWFVVDNRDNTRRPFEDGMTIAI